MRFGLVSFLAVSFVAPAALADETAAPCPNDPDFCATAPLSFDKEIGLPIMGGFDTGWVPQGSPLQVHLAAGLWANTQVVMEGELRTSWPEALSLQTIGTPGAGVLGIHYGVQVIAEAMLQITVLGQNFNWTGPIPYLPQFDFQVEENTPFDPWAFDGVTVSGSTMEQTLAQVSATDFISVNIPGLDGGFELNVKMDLEASYQTDRIELRHPEDGLFAAPPIGAEGQTSIAEYLGGSSRTFDVAPVGTVVYTGVLHLIPAFYIETIGPDFSIPIADIPIPFSIEQKDWAFDPVRVTVNLPDIELDGDPTSSPDAPPVPVIDLGEFAAGTTSLASLQLGNTGEAQLVLSASPSSLELELAESGLSLAPSTSGLLSMAVTPAQAGPIAITVTIDSNDPDEPERSFQVIGVATVAEGGPEDGADDPLSAAFAQGGGCACGTVETATARQPWALSLVGLLALLRRRRPRVVA